jgi:hypothetical protein
MRNTRPGDLSSGYFYEECLAKTALVDRVWGGEGFDASTRLSAAPHPGPSPKGDGSLLVIGSLFPSPNGEGKGGVEFLFGEASWGL